MNIVTLVIAAMAIAGAAHAADQPVVSVQPAPSPAAIAEHGPAPSGDQAGRYCSKDDPFIEYRDCVNASTRDPNAKVRMA